jgi:hypothetical protein
MTKPEPKAKPKVRLNFLLGVPESTLDNYRLAHMSAAANLRKAMLETMDQLIDEMMTAELALWFKGQDRQSLLKALETEEDALTWAKRMIRGGGEILPRPRMSAEEARKHRVESSKRYRQRRKSDLSGKAPHGRAPGTIAARNRKLRNAELAKVREKGVEPRIS